MTVWVGTSGWAYPEWRGDYYPRGLTQRRELEYLADRLSTVELNGSFYSLQRPTSYRAWHDRTPDSFVFAVKGHRFVTHLRRLRSPSESVANFLASGVLELRGKLGPVLWQLPGRMTFDPVLMGEFLAALPRDHGAAADLIARHATLRPEDSVTVESTSRPLRHAVEVRHPSFATTAFRDLLCAHEIAMVRADTAGRWPYFEESTTDFAYVRLHGASELYVSAYRPAELAHWAARIRAWGRTGDVYVYFDNTARAAAPRDAEHLAELVLPVNPADATPGAATTPPRARFH
jgi:uncharacterized protein YecE (DUF72 family)